MSLIQQTLDYIFHLDVYLNILVTSFGWLSYLLLFLVIFVETGLVVFPFLPGDSLLFAAGSIAAQTDNSLTISILMPLLLIASIVGNQVNYIIGKRLGPHIFYKKDSRLLNQKYLEEAHEFYLRHGGKTIIFARFLPIIRTFAPFVAGIGRMPLVQFTGYNIISAVLWVGGLLGLGYFLGSIPLVKENFVVVIYGIIFISLLPPLLTLMRKKKAYRS